jgi:hypothetical protein
MNYKYLAGLAALLLVLNGCINIPIGCETRSTSVIGARVDSTGKVYEQIVRYDKELPCIIIDFRIDPLPLDFARFRYSRYATLTKNSKHAIWAMEHFPSFFGARPRVEFAIPIPDSDRWITIEKAEAKGNLWDIYLIVFSVRKGKIVRHRFRHVLRPPTNDVKAVIWWPYYIEGDANLDWLRVHETDKITRVNTVTGKIIPETEASPPFSHTAIDWEKLWRVKLQHPLRP